MRIISSELIWQWILIWARVRGSSLSCFVLSLNCVKTFFAYCVTCCNTFHKWIIYESAVRKFEFFLLLSCNKYPEYRKVISVEYERDYLWLHALEIWARSCLFNQTNFNKSTWYTVYEYNNENYFDSALKVLELSQLEFTIPGNTASADKSFSALKRYLPSCYQTPT